MAVNLFEAFKKLDDIEELNEEVFDISTDDGLEELDSFMDNDFSDETTEIIDTNAETEEEIKDSYVGDVILSCKICGEKIIKNPEEVKIDEETQLANVGEDCPNCHGVDGFCIIGQVEEFKPDEEENKKEEDEEKDEKEEEDELTESVRPKSAVRRNVAFAPVKRTHKEVTEAPIYGLETQFDSRKSFGGKAQVDVQGDKQTLYSYNTPVCEIEKGKVTLLPKWDSSMTTLRHVKEFLLQNGFKADSKNQIAKDYSGDLKEANLTRAERHNKAMDSIFAGRRARDKRICDYLLKHGYSEEQVNELQKNTGLSNDALGKELLKLGGQDLFKDVVSGDLKESKMRNNSYYRGAKDVKFIQHGAWADPELEYKGKLFNYWDIEDALWEDFLEEHPEYSDSDAYTKKVDDEFSAYVRERVNDYLDDVIAGGYFAESVSKRDDIDAKADNRKEKAKKAFMKAKDDADADRDYKLKKANLEESDKPAATSIEDAQKWVDYDMEKYHRISDKTNDLVKKAGFQIVKDEHGEYEVIAGKYDESLKEDFQKVDAVLQDGDYVFDEETGNIHLSEHPQSKNYINVKFDSGEDDKVYTYKFVEYNEHETNYPYTFEYVSEAKDFLDETPTDENESLKEDFQKVEIETDTEKMSMTSDESGKTTVTTEPKTDTECAECEEDKEVIAPVSDEIKTEIEANSEEEPTDEEEVDIDEFDEEGFDELGESYLKEVYDNVKSYKTTSGKVVDNKLMLEGVIEFNSGKKAKTNFIFESKYMTKKGKLKFLGENLQFSNRKKAFILTASLKNKKLINESFTYNYVAEDANTGKTTKLYGTVKRK